MKKQSRFALNRRNLFLLSGVLAAGMALILLIPLLWVQCLAAAGMLMGLLLLLPRCFKRIQTRRTTQKKRDPMDAYRLLPNDRGKIIQFPKK